MLYSSTDAVIDNQPRDANSFPPIKIVDSVIVEKISEELDALGEAEEEGDIESIWIAGFPLTKRRSSVSGRCTNQSPLLYDVWPPQFHFPSHHNYTDVNRVTSPPNISSSHAKPTKALDTLLMPDPRILVLSVSPDLSTSYIPIMNAIFSAQKLVQLRGFFML
jgi:transcription initiation factor TFIIH subunit 3